MPALVTDLVRLRSFATGHAERPIHHHDGSTLRLRLDSHGDLAVFEPGNSLAQWLSGLCVS
jgi:hypothetical protein